MRIAVNTRLLIPGKLTGVGHFTYEVLKKMVPDHPEVEWIFIFDRPYDKSFVFADNITPVVALPPARAPYLFYIWFELAVPRIIKKYKADLFLSPDNFMSLSIKVPTLLVIHDLAYLHYPEMVSYLQIKYYRYFIPKFIYKSDKIATVSKTTYHDILENFDIHPSKLDVVSLGLNEGFTNDDKAQTGNYFLHLGTIQPRKNIIGLLKSFEIYKNRFNDSSELHFIGNKGWKDKNIYTFLEGMTHKNDVKMIGYLSNEEISAKLNKAIALINISLFEGFGMPVIEAQQCGCPVICSDRSSLPEASGGAAILVDPLNTDAIVEAMFKIKNDQKLRSELILQGYENVKKFSWQNTSDLLWRNIEKLLPPTFDQKQK